MNKYTRNTKWAPAGNFKTLINSLFGETLSAPEIHQFFRTLGVKPQKGEYFGTPNVTLYNMNDVYAALKREKLRQSMRNENKDIKRKVIRLTESDLHRMVQESVKNLLSELDWRTYDTAAKKAQEEMEKAETEYERQRRKNQMDAFRKASIDAYNKKFGASAAAFKDLTKLTNGELKRLHRGAEEAKNYYDGKTQYNKQEGKWSN